MSENLIKIYSPKDNLEADFIKSFLEQANIYCFIQGYQHRSMLDGIGAYIDLGIMVPENHVEEANEIIKEYLKASQVSTSEIEGEDEKE